MTLNELRGHDGVMPGSTTAVAQRRKKRTPVVIPWDICKGGKDGRWPRDEGTKVLSATHRDKSGSFKKETQSASKFEGAGSITPTGLKYLSLRSWL